VTEDFNICSQVDPLPATVDDSLAVKNERRICFDVGHNNAIPSVPGIFNPIHRGVSEEEVESVVKEPAILTVLERLVISGAPAIAEKISSRNGDEVIVGVALDRRFVGGDGLSCLWGAEVGDELQMIAETAIKICSYRLLSLGGSHEAVGVKGHLGRVLI
jgi:hypothetical protein